MTGTTRRSASLVAAGILLSRLAGLLRERVIAQYLGVGVAVDAYRAALRIPNLLQNLLGEGVLSASFIPVYARLRVDDEAEAGRVAGAIAGLLAVLAGVLVVVGVVFARPLTLVLAPGFADRPAAFELTVTLTRILTPGIGLLVLSAWCLGVLNSHRRFFLSYVAPVLWNVAQIGVVVALGLSGASDTGLAEGLAWGALIGSALQLGVQLPSVLALLRPFRPSLRTDRPGVRDALRRFGPVVAGRGVVQLSAYVDLVLASLLAAGAVAALGYAQVFHLLPISLFGMSVAAAELPELSTLEGFDAKAMAARLEDGLGRIAFFVLPTAVAYLFAGDLVVGALLQTGEFGPEEGRLVWYVLGALALGLVATTASRLLQNGLYALGDTRTPARAAAARVALAAALGVVLMLQLDRVVLAGPGLDGLEGLASLPAPLRPLPSGLRTEGGLRLGAVGLALASATAAWLELSLLRRRLRDRLGPLRIFGRRLPALLLAGAALAVVVVVVRPVAAGLHPLLALPVVAVPAGAAHLAVTLALGVPEASALPVLRSLPLPRRRR